MILTHITFHKMILNQHVFFSLTFNTFLLLFLVVTTIMLCVGGPAWIRIILHFFMLHWSDLKVLLRLCNDCWRKADTVGAKYSMCRMCKVDIHLTVSGSFSFFRDKSRVFHSNYSILVSGVVNS